MDIREANEYAKQMMEQHLPGSDWSLTWDRATWRAGAANFDRGEIILSEHAVASYEPWQVEQLMLHEIAHVLVGVHGPDHGKAWKKAAASLGYEGGQFCDDFKKPVSISFAGLGVVLAVIFTLYSVTPALGVVAGVIFTVWLLVRTYRNRTPVQAAHGMVMVDGEWV
jgi:hypothetical protein